ncbi:helix-turn-helix domain-containing protein [Streptomyces sp. NPDC048342]|uniref:helix-turn-helix domain-containing protein n=1 Tax=unclassified Streptomyces TaxID=2593676 RepID=UPI00344498ED
MATNGKNSPVGSGGQDKAPNLGLITLMAQAGLSNKALARRVREVGATRGLELRCTHVTVQRWRNGVASRAVPPEVIAETLTRELGRVVLVSEIGMASSDHALDPRLRLDPRLGLDGPSALPALVDTATALWSRDLDEEGPRLPPVPAATLATPVLRWLTAPPPPAASNTGIGQKVRREDVARVRAATALHAKLDNRYGGGAARSIALAYLRADVLPLLHGTYSASIGRELFAATALATHCTAHLAYDTGRHDLARRYFLLAIDMAHQAGDRPLAAKIMGTLAHQAIFLGGTREALDIVRAALQGAGTAATLTGRAALHAMEARAHAALGDTRATLTALRHSERNFSAARPENEPSWLRYFNYSEFNDEFGHCLVALKDSREAQRYATEALAARSTDYARSSVFTRFVLANAHLIDRDVEQACAVAQPALPAVASIQSVRTRAYLDDFQHRLEPFHRVGAARAFRTRAGQLVGSGGGK